MLKILKLNIKLNFWNLIWYFKLLNLDINFMLPYTKITESTLSIMDNNKYISFQYTDNLNINNNDEKLLNIKLNEDNLNNTLEIFKGKNIIFDKNELSIQNFLVMKFYHYWNDK